MKRIIFLTLCVITATLMVSCDEDTYVKSAVQPSYYKIVDTGHINIYDQYKIFMETRETSFEIREQFDLIAFGNSPLEAIDEDWPRIPISLWEYDECTPEEGILFSVEYNNDLSNKLRILGLIQTAKNAEAETENSDNADIFLLCLNNLVIEAEMEEVERREDPFYQKCVINYTLKADDIVLARAEQWVTVIND